MLKVKGVIENSPADSIGIKAGDQILSIQGNRISSQREFNAEIYKLRGNDSEALLEWRRDGQNFDAKVDANKSIGFTLIDDVVEPQSLYVSSSASLQGKSGYNNSNSAPSTQQPESRYGFARFTGVLATVIGVLMLLAGIYWLFSYFSASSYRRELAPLIYGVSGLVWGVITIGVGQVVAAVADAADNSFKILDKLSKN